MLVRHLVPMVVMGGIAAHSGPALKARALNAVGLGDKIIARQRIGAILAAAELHAVANEDFAIKSQSEFRQFVRTAVRIKGESRNDPSIDPWGTPFSGTMSGRTLTVVSAEQIGGTVQLTTCVAASAYSTINHATGWAGGTASAVFAPMCPYKLSFVRVIRLR